jgi:hypothetical protein
VVTAAPRAFGAGFGSGIVCARAQAIALATINTTSVAREKHRGAIGRWQALVKFCLKLKRPLLSTLAANWRLWRFRGPKGILRGRAMM